MRALLTVIPSARLPGGLRQWRDGGRDDNPVSELRGVSLLTVLLRHPSIEACLAEFRRNPSLPKRSGIESEENVAKKWNISCSPEAQGQEPPRALCTAAVAHRSAAEPET